MREDEPWLAEAAMHRILRRTLPAQRHEVLGALSALKLQLAVASRRAAGVPGQGGHTDGADTPAGRLAQLQGMAEQQLAAQTALTGLRLWDGMSVQRRSLADVLGESVAWARQAAAVLGHRLEAPQIRAHAAEAGAPPALPQVQVPAAHHLVLGLLYEALDRLQTPSVLVPQVQPDGPGWRLWLETTPRDDAPAMPAIAADAGVTARPPGQPVPRISVAMLDALARHATAPEGTWQLVSAGDAPGASPSALRYEAFATPRASGR